MRKETFGAVYKCSVMRSLTKDDGKNGESQLLTTKTKKMLELLKEQLKDYLSQYQAIKLEINELFEKDKFSPLELKSLSEKLVGVKRQIEVCVLEIKKYNTNSSEKALE